MAPTKMSLANPPKLADLDDEPPRPPPSFSMKPAGAGPANPALPLRHRLHPATSDAPKPPLLLLLHGAGADENDLFGLAPHLAPACGGAAVASLRGPVERPYGFAWFDGSSADPEPSALSTGPGSIVDAVAKVKGFIEAAPEVLGTDPSKVFLFGFSQGATIGWSLLLSQWPSKTLLAGAACMSGRAMPELMRKGTPLSATLASPSELELRPPIFAAHGVADMTTPVDLGRATLEIAKAAGLATTGSSPTLKYMEHRGGHELPRDAMQATVDVFKRGMAAAEWRLAATPAELQQGQLAAGTRVLISGLKGRADLNGKLGTIKKYVASRSRYEVVVEDFEGLSEVLGLRAECVEVAPEAWRDLAVAPS